MIRKIFLAILLVVLVIGGLGAVKALQFKKMMAGDRTPPPETVSSFVAREEHWQGTLSAIGSVTAAQGVNVTSELPGLIREITFESGAVVKQGDLLVRLDTSSEEAQLRSVEAQLELARLNLKRTSELRSQNMVSQSDLDTAEATVKQTQANADTIRTTIDKKTIRAPFAGRLGIRQINLGQYLETGKPIVSLQSLAPIYGDFSLPQQELAQLKPGMRVRLSTDAFPDRHFEGTLSAINPDLDPSTRSVGLQATFDTQEQLLRPGMFARFEVLLPQQQKVLVIPATAVLSQPFGDSVYVIEPDPDAKPGKPSEIVSQQFIKLGRERGDYVTVTTGLKAGDKVASAGVFKLRNKMHVVENNDLVPKADLAPKPADS